MTDSRVEALATWYYNHGEPNDYDGSSDFTVSDFHAGCAAQIAACEAAGLLVLADDEDTVNRLAAFLDFEGWYGLDEDALARMFFQWLRSSPPAGFPAAGGAPRNDATGDDDHRRTHDGVRTDKAVDPHDDLGGQRDTIRGSNG